MSYLEVFGVLTVVGVDALKSFGVGTGAESESEKYDSAYLWLQSHLNVQRLSRPCKACLCGSSVSKHNLEWAFGSRSVSKMCLFEDC